MLTPRSPPLYWTGFADATQKVQGSCPVRGKQFLTNADTKAKRKTRLKRARRWQMCSLGVLFYSCLFWESNAVTDSYCCSLTPSPLALGALALSSGFKTWLAQVTRSRRFNCSQETGGISFVVQNRATCVSFRSVVELSVSELLRDILSINGLKIVLD